MDTDTDTDKGGWFFSLNQIDNPKARLICFANEGGDGGFFKDWFCNLRPDIEVLLVQLPGRGHRASEEPLTNVMDVIEGLMSDSQVYLDKPYILFGHSLGATLAYEMANKIVELGWRLPKRLIISGRQAPTDTRSYFQKMTHLEDQDFFEDLVNDDCLSQWVMNAPEQVAENISYIRADFQMLELYSPQPIAVLDIPVDVFAGSRDSIPLGNLLEWQKVCRYPVHVCVFKGGHFFVEEDKASVLNRMRELFDELIVSGAYA